MSEPQFTVPLSALVEITRQETETKEWGWGWDCRFDWHGPDDGLGFSAYVGSDSESAARAAAVAHLEQVHRIAAPAPVETRTEWAVSGCDIGDDENFVDPVSERLDAEANAYDLRVSGRYRDVHVVSRTVTTINSEWKRVDDV